MTTMLDKLLAENSGKKSTLDHLLVGGALQKEREQPNPFVEGGTALLQGINKGLVETAAIPGRAVNTVANAVVPESYQEFSRTLPWQFLQFRDETDPNSLNYTQNLLKLAGPDGLNITYENIKDVPKTLRPFAKAGEVGGASIPFLALTGPYVGSRTLFNEGLSITSAMQGAFYAELYDPGDEWTALMAEVGAGIVNPYRLVATGFSKLTDGLKAAVNQFFPQNTERAAGKAIARALVTKGENVTDVIKGLKADTVAPSQTAAQKTGSPVLIGIERTMMRGSHDYKTAIGKQTERALAEFNEAYKTAVKTGNPELLRIAAIARREAHIMAMNRIADSAEQRVNKAIAAVKKSDSAAITTASRKVEQIIRDAHDDARNIESSLWGRIDTKVLMDRFDGTKSAFAEASNDLATKETLSAVLKNAGANNSTLHRLLKKVKKGSSMPSGDLIRLRSLLLEADRKLRSTKDFDAARRARVLAEGIRKDVLEISDDARLAGEFSKELNDKFSKSWAGRVLSTDSTGAPSVHPDLVFDKMGTGREYAVRAKQVQDAVTPSGLKQADEFVDDASRQRPQDFLNEEEIFARGMADNPNQADLLARHPNVRQAAETQRLLEQRLPALQGKIANIRKVAERDSAFAKVLGYDYVADAFIDALGQKDRSAAVARLFSLAKKDPARYKPSAAGGFFEAVLTMSSSKGNLNSAAIFDVLNDSKLMREVRKGGGVQKHEIDALRKIAGEIKSFNDSLSSAAEFDAVLDAPSAALNLLARLGGSNIGSNAVFSKASGASLVMAYYGSRTAQSIIEKMPRQRIGAVIKEAGRNPEFMAELLTPWQKLSVERQMRLQDRLLAHWHGGGSMGRPATAYLGGASSQFLNDTILDDEGY